MHSEKHPLDELLRKSLDGHRMVPSEDAQRHFLEEALKLPANNRSRKRRFWFISILSLAVISAVTVYLTLNQQDIPSHTSNQTIPVRDNMTKDRSSVSSPDEYNSGSERMQPTNSKNSVSTIKSKVSTIIYTEKNGSEGQGSNPDLMGSSTHVEPMVQQSESSTSLLDLNEQYPEKAIVNHDTIETSGQPTAAIMPAASFLSTDSLAGSSGNLSADLASDTNHIKDPDEKQRPKREYRTAGKMQFATGVHYTPEWMFNTIEGVKFVNNVGFEGILRSGRFNVRTGLGISVSKGVNELTVAYNDYLGSYNHLDSMDFTWSEPIQNYLPTFYMTNKDVWDSLLKLDYPRVIKQYFYLQVPLILGYDVVETVKFRLGFRVGPVLSILLSSKQLSEDYDPGLKKIISINNIPPEQVNLNWQAMFGINTSFRTRGRISIELEPYIRYYFNSVYEKPSQSMKPWSAGLRAAFLIEW
jgi:hypothetical protein